MFQPEDGDLAAGLSHALQEQSRNDEAMIWARRAVELDGADPRHRELLGDLYEARGDVERALAQYEAGVAVAPRDSRLRAKVARARAALR
jgi:Flp pilus assembly protein TadD